MTNLAIGAIAAAIIGFAGYRAHALTPSGAIAAFAVGTLTYGAGGIPFAIVLLAFFISSVLLGRIGRARKRELTDIGKSGARDAWQVLANGGIATVCACVSAIFLHLTRTAAPFGIDTTPSVERPEVWMIAFCGAYAAATADTWGTEIGTLARGLPRSILTLKPIATGLSGGITAAGTLAEVAGAIWTAVIGVIAFAFTYIASGTLMNPNRVAIAIVAGGIIGAVVDSLLGASTQELRHCPACDRACETDPHVCGSPTRLVRGAGWFSNDLVNFAATLAGAGTAFIIAAV
jgi:uncharacterized protein (TIGR00297 family)